MPPLLQSLNIASIPLRCLNALISLPSSSAALSTNPKLKADLQLAHIHLLTTKFELRHREHVNRCLKVFKILCERYRNRQRRFSLRFNWIAGLYNYELTLTNIKFV
ncbi:hypothetical protein BWI75_11395 [Gloeocapsopsis sp. AAB1 = 1H9]|uniref:DDE Tnp4 domain-containing protein n=1 Tax=Gloeocapsopsis dulcis AAB1 = 1H9 TaxID=1433147 RepID=A0A6N8FV03_9CHRO|nr:hypothetical protein [Gloeocapsopsis dulcis AAB1 = 1H9]